MREQSRASKEYIDEHLRPDIRVTHSLQSPVFVIGQARSGTTILGNLIRKYLKVNFGPESQFFIRIRNDLDKYGDLEQEQNFVRLVEDIAAERCFELNQFGYSVDVERVAEEAPRDYPGCIDFIYSSFAKHNGMNRWGDKTPDYVNNLFELDQMFPNAQYVHIVRDGRDVALSNFNVFFGAKNAVVAAREWHRMMQVSSEFFGTIPNRHIEIRYEDFMQNPTKVLLSIAEFLGINVDLELRDTVLKSVPEEVVADNFGKWKTLFSERQKLAFERVAQKSLKSKGYEVVYKDVAPISKVENLFWTLDHVTKKYASIGAWADNWYKLRLRTRSLLRSFS